MKIKVEKTESQPFPEGKHNLKLYGFCHVGKVRLRADWSPVDKFIFLFECTSLPKEVFDESKGEQRKAINRTLFGQKLYDFLEELLERSLTAKERNEGFEVADMIGTEYRVLVDHTKKDDKTYSNIKKIIEPLDGDGEQPENQTFCFSVNFNPKTKEAFETQSDVLASKEWSKLPEWIQKEIKEKSLTFQALDE